MGSALKAEMTYMFYKFRALGGIRRNDCDGPLVLLADDGDGQVGLSSERCGVQTKDLARRAAAATDPSDDVLGTA